MSYASLVKTLPETLSSSTSLAVLASLGVHGLLLAVLPVLPFESKELESPSQRTVGLIELTPAEQSRLPQSTSDVTLPPFATQQSGLPPLPPPPPIQTGVLPPLPALPQSFQLAPNKAISGNSQRVSSSQTKTFRVPTRIAIKNPTRSAPNQPLRSGELLPPPRRGNWRPPRVSGLPSTRGLTAQRFDPNSFPPTSPNSFPPSPPTSSFPPSPSTVTLPSPPPLVPENPNLPNPNLPQNTNPQRQPVAANPQTPPTPTVRSPQGFENTKRELLAKRNQIARANRAAPAATPPASENSEASRSREQLLAALRQQRNEGSSANSTSVATAETIRHLEKFKTQQQRVQSEHPKIETRAPIRQNIKTCQRQFDGSVAYVAAVVNPQGNIISGPNLSDNKGTVDIAQAKDFVRSYPFQSTGNTTNYNFAIEFDYNTGKCSEPTTGALPENRNQQSRS